MKICSVCTRKHYILPPIMCDMFHDGYALWSSQQIDSRVLRRDTRVLWYIGYPSETHFKLKSREIPFVHNIWFSDSIQSFWNFTKNTAMIPPCSAQNFKTIGIFKWMLWTKKISRDLSLNAFLHRYPVLHSIAQLGISRNTAKPTRANLAWFTLDDSKIYQFKVLTYLLCVNLRKK